jgi:hypothetical protein
MSTPSPRQQAGYLRRLIRRGEIEVLDPNTGRPTSVLVELQGEVIRLVPLLESLKAETPVVIEDLELDSDTLRWASVMARLRAALTLAQAEELVGAVEAEIPRGAREDAVS